jgi:hypothetical protein
MEAIYSFETLIRTSKFTWLFQKQLIRVLFSESILAPACIITVGMLSSFSLPKEGENKNCPFIKRALDQVELLDYI